MICLYLTQPSSSFPFSFKPSLTLSSISKFKPPLYHLTKTNKKKKIKGGICRAEFSPDAPLAAAIGACMLSSLLLPATDTDDEDGGNSIIDAGDTRFAAMGIISLIPYFNWLLEASIKNGDLQGFQIFSEAAKHLSSRSREEDKLFKGHKEPEVRKGEYRNLPDAEEQSGNEIRRWRIPRKPSQHHEQSNGDWDDDGRSEH